MRVNTCDKRAYSHFRDIHSATVMDGIDAEPAPDDAGDRRDSYGALCFRPDGGSPKRGGRLTIGADADPIGLDPATVTAFSSFDFTSLLYTGLLRWTADMKMEPDLAVGYEQPNDTTYVFKPAHGVKFHNGQELDAEDVKYTFDRILNPATASPNAPFLDIRAVTVVDPLTVRSNSKPPTRRSSTISQPTGRGYRAARRQRPQHAAGRHRAIHVQILSAQSAIHPEGEPELLRERSALSRKVVFRFFKDQATLTSALRSKAIDMTWLKDPKVSAQSCETSPDLVSAPGKTTRTFPVWMNMKAKPLNDVRVRRALSLATDRKACLETVLGGSGKMAP